MSKTIESPVKKWSGSVTIADPLSLSQVIGIEDAIGEAGALKEQRDPSKAKYQRCLAPALLDCIEAWNITGLAEKQIPGSPRVDSINFFAWILAEVMKIYNEAIEVPNV